MNINYEEWRDLNQDEIENFIDWYGDKPNWATLECNLDVDEEIYQYYLSEVSAEEDRAYDEWKDRNID